MSEVEKINEPTHTNLPEPQRSSTSSPINSLESKSPGSVHPEIQETPAQDNLSELSRSQEAVDSYPPELQQTCAPASPNLSEVPKSPDSFVPDSTDFQHPPIPLNESEVFDSPQPIQPDLTNSPKSTLSEVSENPKPIELDSAELHHTSSGPNSDTVEEQKAPEALHPDPLEIKQYPTLPNPNSEVQQSSPPSDFDPSDVEKGPELVCHDSTALQTSTTPTHPGLQQHSEPAQPDLSDFQHQTSTNSDPLNCSPTDSISLELPLSSVTVHSDSTDLQVSSESTQSDPVEPQQSPKPANPDSPEMELNLEPLQHKTLAAEPTDSEPSDVQKCPKSDHSDFSFTKDPALSQPSSPQLQEDQSSIHHHASNLQRTHPANPSPLKLKQGPTSPQSPPPDIQQISAFSNPDPVKIQLIKSLETENDDPSDIEVSHEIGQHGPESLKPTHSEKSHLICKDYSEPQCSPLEIETPACEVQHEILPLKQNPAELQELFQGGPTELQGSPKLEDRPTPSPPIAKSSSTQCLSGSTDLFKTELSPSSPVELQQSPTHMILTQASNSLTHNFSEEHLTAKQPQPNSPLPCGLAQSPAEDTTAQTQSENSGISSVVILMQSPTKPHYDAPCNMTFSPACPGISSSQSPIQNDKSTLDHKTSGFASSVHLHHETEQDTSTLDQDTLPVCHGSTQTKRRHTSAPCSPVQSRLRPTPACSLSLPGSPVQVDSTQHLRPLLLSPIASYLTEQSTLTGESSENSNVEMLSVKVSSAQLSPNKDAQTLESNPTFENPTMHHNMDAQLSHQSSMISPEPSSPCSILPVPPPESLLHTSTSVEHSSLTLSPSADKVEETSSPSSHIHQTPLNDTHSGSMEAKADPQPQPGLGDINLTHTNEIPVCPTLQANSSTICSASSINPNLPETVISADSPLCQDEEMQAAVNTLAVNPETKDESCNPEPLSVSPLFNDTQTSPVSKEGNGDSLHADTHLAQSPVASCPSSPMHPCLSSPKHPSNLQQICQSPPVICPSSPPNPSPSSLPDPCLSTPTNPCPSSPLNPLSSSSSKPCPLSPSDPCPPSPSNICLRSPSNPCPQSSSNSCPQSPSHPCPESPSNLGPPSPTNPNPCPESPSNPCSESPSNPCVSSPLILCPSSPTHHCPLSPAHSSPSSPTHPCPPSPPQPCPSSPPLPCSTNSPYVEPSSPLLVTVAGFSPSHCSLTDPSPNRSSVSHNLSNIASESCVHPDPNSAILTGDSILHVSPRSSPAGQASPVHITSTGVHLSRKSSSLTNSPHSSSAHTPVIGSPPCSPTQAVESPADEPHYSSANDTGTIFGHTVTQTSYPLPISATQSTLFTGEVTLSPSHESPDPFSSNANSNLDRLSQPPVCPEMKHNESSASVSLSNQRPSSPANPTATQPASPGSSLSSDQDNTVVPGSSHSPHPAFVDSQVSPVQTQSVNRTKVESPVHASDSVLIQTSAISGLHKPALSKESHVSDSEASPSSEQCENHTITDLNPENVDKSVSSATETRARSPDMDQTSILSKEEDDLEKSNCEGKNESEASNQAREVKKFEVHLIEKVQPEDGEPVVRTEGLQDKEQVSSLGEFLFSFSR